MIVEVVGGADERPEVRVVDVDDLTGVQLALGAVTDEEADQALRDAGLGRLEDDRTGVGRRGHGGGGRGSSGGRRGRSAGPGRERRGRLTGRATGAATRTLSETWNLEKGRNSPVSSLW
jgi:hypothetical protein